MRADPESVTFRARKSSAFAQPLALGIALVCLSAPAMAQSVSDYRLPEQRQDARQSRAQGPVDAENPVIAPATQPTGQATGQAAIPRPAPSPVPTAAPTISPPPPPRAVATPPPSATPAPRATGSATPAPAPQPNAPETPVEQPPEFAPEPTIAEPAVESTATDVAPPAESEDVAATSAPAVPWLWTALAAALAGLAGIVLVLRRRIRQNRTDDADWAEPEPARPVAPQPAPPAKLPDPARAQTPPSPAPAATPAIPSASRPPSPPEALPLAIGFEPRAMRLSLVYATLPYRLTVENRGNDPVGPVRVLADLGSAHASLSTDEQLAPDPATLEARHALESLGPGETVTLSGELRAPLGSVLALRSGGASLFVPLARFCLIPGQGAAMRRVFMVGQPGTDAAAPLSPIRLDTGPRQIDGLAAREIEAARLLALDPLRQAS